MPRICGRRKRFLDGRENVRNLKAVSVMEHVHLGTEWNFRSQQSHVDVIHQHEKDREGAEQIDPIAPGPTPYRVARLL
jgi:hypothetical protein